MEFPVEGIDVTLELSNGVRSDAATLEFDGDRSPVAINAINIDRSDSCLSLGRPRLKVRLDEFGGPEDPLFEVGLGARQREVLGVRAVVGGGVGHPDSDQVADDDRRECDRAEPLR